MASKKETEFRTIGMTGRMLGGKLQSWLIQDGITTGGSWKWRTVVSKEDADNDKEALKVAQDRYKAGVPSSIFKEEVKKSEAA